MIFIEFLESQRSTVKTLGVGLLVKLTYIFFTIEGLNYNYSINKQQHYVFTNNIVCTVRFSVFNFGVCVSNFMGIFIAFILGYSGHYRERSEQKKFKM